MKRFFMTTAFHSILLALLMTINFQSLNAAETAIHIDWLDKNTLPQNDFHQFANGAWLSQASIPKDKVIIGSLYDLRDKTRIELKNLIESLALESKLTDEENQILSFYQSFTNEALIEKKDSTPLTLILNDISSINSPESLWAFFAKATLLGITTPFSVFVDVDQKDASNYALYFSQSGIGLPDRDYYLDEKNFKPIIKGYKQLIIDLFKANKEDHVKQKAKITYKIETELANKHWDKVRNRDVEKLYNPFNSSNIEEVIPASLLKVFFSQLDTPMPKKIIIEQPDYFRHVVKLSNETDINQWKTYLTLQTLRAYAPYLPERFSEKHHIFYDNVLAGQNQQKPRNERAVQLLNNEIGELVGKLYIKHFFSEEKKQKVLSIVDRIKDAYKQSFAELDWMSEPTKIKARQKLDSLIVQIGYPDQWTDFRELSIHSNDLIGNIFHAREFQLRKNLALLGQPIQEWKWVFPPQISNAYYDPPGRKILFTAAILQPPLFDMAAEDASNYGAMGAIIGHEMGHAFDDQGRKTDSLGNLNDWWTKKDEEAFNQKVHKLVEQYNQYTVLNNLPVNGELTLGENIGDLTGVSIAFKAFQLSQKNKEKKSFHGFTPEQRFFLAWAQSWAVKETDASLSTRIHTDPHSPAKWRTNGPLSNIEAFYEAFDITSADKMYLPIEKRTNLWSN